MKDILETVNSIGKHLWAGSNELYFRLFNKLNMDLKQKSVRKLSDEVE